MCFGSARPGHYTQEREEPCKPAGERVAGEPNDSCLLRLGQSLSRTIAKRPDTPNTCRQMRNVGSIEASSRGLRGSDASSAKTSGEIPTEEVFTHSIKGSGT